MPLFSVFQRYPLEIILVLIYIFLIFAAPGFATLDNQLNVLRNVTMMGIIAFGMTMVIISGEIDLSVGSGVAFSGCLTAWVTRELTPFVGAFTAITLGAIAAMVALFCVGVFTGKLRQHFNMPTFITTLGLLTVLSGAANLITGGFPITAFPYQFNFLGAGVLFGIPFPVYIFVAVFLFVSFLMNYTSFGRAVYAVGGNLEAARLSGIDVWRTKTLALGLTGVFTAIAGILIASQILSGSASAARGWELDVISAVIIGGTSLFGGKGTVRGTLIGVLFLGVIVNGMTLLNVSEYWQFVVRGMLIIGAVLMNHILDTRVRG
ncbi:MULTISPECIES: ABC transporter permease [unclassified Roseitalea]|uniref:ABC transporter permease n=1 Tax=unclassified Roseitalea TaxID=2639107 RepID=UPI00273F2814|nr:MULTISPECIES: ABC transporter permease [unclassified Roseitalea]